MPMQQHPHYGAAMALLGAQVRRAVISEAGTPFGVAQVITRVLGPLRLSLLSRGPVWLTARGGAARGRVLRQLAEGAGVFFATPEHPLKARGLLTVAAPRQQAVIGLCAKPDALRARMAGKWRNRLARAEAAGLETGVRIPVAADLDWLMRHELAQRKARRYRALPPAFTLAWQRVAPDALRYYEARLGKRRVAAMLFLLHPPWASYHVGWSGDEGRRMNAHNALLWRAMRDLQSRGFAALDLGPVDGDANPGLARFKAGTGAVVAPLGATSLVLPALIRRRW
ncbi:MAG: GNAT family N-acetyltransferase [Rhodobacteraceae bacterium]|nr:GNAT family N-acetyltransferase [Paracoccaceae bacterium]